MLHKTTLKLIFSIYLIGCTYWLPAQTFWEANYGVNVGLSIALGSQFKHLGISVNAYTVIEQIQFNVHLRWQQHFKTFANLKGHEWQTGIGLLYGYGHTDTLNNVFITPISNQTHQSHSIAYTYNHYFDNMGTSQGSGTIGLEFNRWGFVMENDLLGSSGQDRYRTGAFAFYYRDEKWSFAINNILWTGDALHAPKVRDSNYKARYGYLDMSKAPLGKTSHGILALQAKYAFDYGQIAQADLGIDSEQVRNAIQNRLIHDLYFFPAKWNKTQNFHIPMIDDKGEIYTYKEGQNIRPVKLFYNIGLNESLFY